jgi:hypothetical protein
LLWNNWTDYWPRYIATFHFLGELKQYKIIRQIHVNLLDDSLYSYGYQNYRYGVQNFAFLCHHFTYKNCGCVTLQVVRWFFVGFVSFMTWLIFTSPDYFQDFGVPLHERCLRLHRCKSSSGILKRNTSSSSNVRLKINFTNLVSQQVVPLSCPYSYNWLNEFLSTTSTEFRFVLHWTASYRNIRCEVWNLMNYLTKEPLIVTIY